MPMELVATKVVAGGAALARADDGRVVLVDGALPGERVEVEITADRADHLRARVAAVLDPSPDRITPPCEHARAGCGGCTWQHVAPAAQLTLKTDIVRDALSRIAGVREVPFTEPIALPSTGYRTTVRALVSGGRAAFRRRASHEPVGIDHCLVAHPLVDDLLHAYRYDGAREITVRAAVATGERMVLADPARARFALPDDVSQGRDARVHEVVEDVRLRVSARSFFQTRTDGAAALARLVRGAVGPRRVVADLYCGVGLFAATLDDPERVIAVERSGSAVADARVNLRDHPARVIRADVARWRPEPVDVVVADPSRAGLGRDGAAVVAATGAPRIVLVSCDAAALARDVALFDSRGYRPRSVTLVDLFPHTPHVECMTVLES